MGVRRPRAVQGAGGRTGATAGGSHCHSARHRRGPCRKAATTTIPIVFSSGTDPVQVGLVPSLKRPGGNLTGVNYMQSELGAKRLGLLHEMVPLASRIALLANPTNSVAAEATIKDVGTAAVAIGRQVDVVKAATAPEIEAAFGKIVPNRVDAL